MRLCCCRMAMAMAQAVMYVALVAMAMAGAPPGRLRFRKDGTFKILQIADMHYADGEKTPCKDVLASEMQSCSDLNTTALVKRLLSAENPDFVVFTGDNIDFDASDAVKSMDEAFAPVIEAKVPWAAVLGNHDQESSLPRADVMSYITKMEFSLSRAHPQNTPVETYGWGNFHLQVFGPQHTTAENRSMLNLYFLDSGDYSKVDGVEGYDWIRASQQVWFQNLSSTFKDQAGPPGDSLPGLAYFHIPLPEFGNVLQSCSIVGEHQERVCSASVNSGFFTSLIEAGDVKAAFVGHDHINDYCGELLGVQLCYGGGVGYHAYGKAGWPRRARVVLNSLHKNQHQGIKQIQTWKRLDVVGMTTKDVQVLWDKARSGCPLLSTGSESARHRAHSCWHWPAVFVGGLALLIIVSSALAVYLFFKVRKLEKGYVPYGKT